MRIRSDQLSRELSSARMAPLWLVSGDEPLLVGEAADAIRGRARELGFSERETFFVEPRFDWGPVLGSSQSLSLFATQRLLGEFRGEPALDRLDADHHRGCDRR